MNSTDLETTVLQTTQVAGAINRLERFFGTVSRAENARLATLMGPSRVGKTTISKTIRKMYPPIETESGIRLPVIFVSVGASVTIKSFYRGILKSMKVPSRANDNINILQERAQTFLERFCVEVLILDEFQHLVRTLGINRAGVCDTIKTLMNDGRSIIAMGNEEMTEVINHDPQLVGRRIADIRLYPFCHRSNPRFSLADGKVALRQEFAEYIAILKNFSERFECPDVAFLIEPKTAREILEITHGLYGRTFDLLREAAEFERGRGSTAISPDGLLHAQREIVALEDVETPDGLSEFIDDDDERAGRQRSASQGARKSFTHFDEVNRRRRNRKLECDDEDPED